MKSAEELTVEIDRLVSDLDEIARDKRTSQAGGSVDDRMTIWRGRASEWLRENLGEEFVWQFDNKKTGPWGNPDGTVQDRHRVWGEYLLSVHVDIKQQPEWHLKKHEDAVRPQLNPKTAPVALDEVKGLLRRFHIATVQLSRRHENRETLVIADEYDVQDFLHALLKTRFDDVRAEEVTPSYAGGSSRMDFFLKTQGIGIEVKLATRKLTDRRVGEQLTVDIARYQTHGECRVLVCFIYDPEGHLTNPAGLINDLSKSDANLSVEVVIAPGAA